MFSIIFLNTEVVHELEEVLLEIVLSPGLKLDVECTLVKLNHSMDLIQDQSVFESLIESHNVNDIVLFVIQIWNQF